MSGTAAAPPDAGLQAQRTALSWQRTGLAMLANGLLALRGAWARGEPPALALVLLLGAALLIGYGQWRRRHLLAARGPTATAAGPMAAIAGITLLACLVGLVSMQAFSPVPAASAARSAARRPISPGPRRRNPAPAAARR